MARDLMRVEVSPNWRAIVAALKDAGGITREEAGWVTAGAAEEAELTAKHFLEVMIYDAPLPQSAYFEGPTDHGHPGVFVYPDGPGYYLEHTDADGSDHSRRTGNLWRSVKHRVEGEGEESVAVAYIDRANYDAFEYALAIEYGMLDEYPTFYPRPFWHATKALMRINYRREGQAAARRIAARIKGRFI